MKFTDEQLRDFFNEIDMCYSSGISITDSIDVVNSELDEDYFNDALIVVSESLHNGNNLYDSMNLVEGFDDYMLSVIKVGEKTGYLEKVFKELASYYERLHSMRKKLKEALTYPLVLIVSMMIVLFVLVTRILPIFKEVLNSMGTDLNNLSYILMDIGNFISAFGLIIIIFMVVIVLAYYIYTKNKYKDKWLIRFFHTSVFTRKLSREFATSKYLYGLNLLLKSGYYNEDLLEMLNSLVENNEIRDKCEFISNEYKKDRDLTSAIINADLLNNRSSKLLKIGYRSGKSDEILDRICSDYDSSIDEAINRFVNTIEPVLIIICVLMVAIIMLSVMLPLISILAGL